MVVILSLNSCSSAVSVGAFIGNAGTSSKGIKKSFSDTYLKTKVLAKISLLDIKNIANISVNVSRGTILYTGYVMSAEKRLLIVRKTWEVEGVKKIINELKITNPDPNKVKTFGTSLHIKKPKIIAKTRLRYLIGVTKDASANL